MFSESHMRALGILYSPNFYLDLTLEKLFELVKLPPEDKKILVDSMMKELGIKSTSEKLYGVLKG